MFPKDSWNSGTIEVNFHFRAGHGTDVQIRDCPGSFGMVGTYGLATLAVSPSFIDNDAHFLFILEFCKALNMLCQVIDKYLCSSVCPYKCKTSNC